MNNNESDAGSAAHRTCLVSSYASGSTRGKNLGSAGYSYDFVVGLFRPLFEQLCGFETIAADPLSIDGRSWELSQSQTRAVHFCFRGLHDAEFSQTVPNVVAPAWEFPDVPDEDLGGDPWQNWVRIANRSDLVLLHGEFTRAAFERAGVKTPIAVVPVPTPLEYFEVEDRASDSQTRIDCPAIVLRESPSQTKAVPIRDSVADSASPLPRRAPSRSTVHRIALGLRQIYRQTLKPRIPSWIHRGVAVGLREAMIERAMAMKSRTSETSGIDLQGVVYTSIFNPMDGRKNWEDMLSAFLIALGDRPDATLVLKIIGRNRSNANELLARYRDLNIPHRCRIVVITEFLSDAQMLQLTAGSTYYLTTTRAEGNCLPLMNFLAAGRPAVSPCHTAISDYFGEDMGFVVESHSEPCAWPQDPYLSCRTTWQRIVWPSLVQRLQESYEVARHQPQRYAAMATAARDISHRRHHPDAVLHSLRAAIDQAFSERSDKPVNKVA